MNRWIFHFLFGPWILSLGLDGEHRSWWPEMFHDTPPLESKHCKHCQLVLCSTGGGNFSNGSIGGNKIETQPRIMIIDTMRDGKQTCLEPQRLTEFFRNLWWFTRFFMWAPLSLRSISLKATDIGQNVHQMQRIVFTWCHPSWHLQKHILSNWETQKRCTRT